MRFDDTNPAAESMEYVNSILRDVRWLVGQGNRSGSGQRLDSSGEGAVAASGVASSAAAADPWYGPVRRASDYFPAMYAAAEYLIESGKAYVDDLSAEEMREFRGK
jgi:glutaminyl-tRNA synthetase